MYFEKEMASIEYSVSINDHSCAYAAGAELIGAIDLATDFKSIVRSREQKGYLANELYELQLVLLTELRGVAKARLTVDEYKQFRAAI